MKIKFKMSAKISKKELATVMQMMKDCMVMEKLSNHRSSNRRRNRFNKDK